MDFTFSAEQDALRDAVRSWLGREVDLRALLDEPDGTTDRAWAQLAELGWLGLLVPEAHGGLGLGLVDLVVVQEEMGRLPFPGPFLSSAVQATLAARRLGANDLLVDLASGARRGTVALEEQGAGDPLDRIATTATRRGDGWVLDGGKPVVLDGHRADWAIVVARDEGGIAGFLVDAPAAEPVPALDVTRRLSRLVLDGRPARRLGPDGDQRALWARVLDDVSIALCAETVGTCDRALEMATSYAAQRVQFGRPIGSFQAIRHKIVDMLHQVELCRVGTHYAAWCSDVDDPDRELATAMATGYVGEAANVVTGENIQVHGGVGFTWDVDCHLLFRRAKQDDVLLGQSGWHRQRVAELVLVKV